MKTIICNFNLFKYEHAIQIFDDANACIEMIAVSDLEHLPQAIITACHHNSIHKVHLIGGADLFLQEIATEISNLNEIHYSNFTIDVEVN